MSNSVKSTTLPKQPSITSKPIQQKPDSYSVWFGKLVGISPTDIKNRLWSMTDIKKTSQTVISTFGQILHDSLLALSLQGLQSHGKVFEPLYLSLFDPKSLKVDTELLRETFETFKTAAPKSNLQEAASWFSLPTFLKGKNDQLDFSTIVKSKCRKEALFSKIQSLSGKPFTQTDFLKMTIFDRVFLPTMQQELKFRVLVQDILLKRLVGKVIKHQSPKYANIVDHKAYAAFRILLTGYLSTHTEDDITQIIYNPEFIVNIFYGALKEFDGLSSSIVAHFVNELIAQMKLGIAAPC